MRPPSGYGGPPPWHLWGNTQTVTLPVIVPPFSGLVSDQTTSGQTNRISYKRPESWHWLFSARILNADDSVLPGQTASISLFFDLTVGIGRAMQILPAFETYAYGWGPIVAFPKSLRYSTTVHGPDRSSFDTRDNLISEITAQDIQLGVRGVYITNITGAQPATVEVSAHFSPKCHVRPDWFSDEQFLGSETDGH